MSRAAAAVVEPPKDPADYRRRPRIGGWLMLGFALVCMAAGVAATLLALNVLAHRPAARSTEAPAPLAPPAETAAAAPPAAPTSTAAPPPGPQVDELAGRVASLEASADSTRRAAAAALAAAALVEASQGSRPFPEEAAAVRALQAGAPEIDRLARLAAVGAPSRASLVETFPDYAARAASAARKPGDGARLTDRLAYALAQVVMVRRVGDVAGDGPDAELARAERSVGDGDFDAAFAALDKLPPAAREAMSGWRVRAERRAEVDRLVAALRARALRDVAASGRGGP